MDETSEIGLVPGTASKILWHFTGGPEVIDDNSGERAKSPKLPDKAYEILTLILKSGLLKTSREIVRYKYPSDSEPREIHRFNCCCVAEIPIQHLQYHAVRYGKFALGFHRDNLKGEYRFRPVQYAFDHDDWVVPNANNLRILVEEGFFEANSFITALQKQLEISGDDVSEEYKNNLKEAIDGLNLRRKVFGERRWSAEMQLRFIKSFHEEEFGTVYCEREWRKVDRGTCHTSTFVPFCGEEGEGLLFEPKDLCFIVCPQDYAKSLTYTIQYDSDFKKYTGIPIVPHEDLVEH